MSNCFVDDDGDTRCGPCTLERLYDDVPYGVTFASEVPEEVLEAAGIVPLTEEEAGEFVCADCGSYFGEDAEEEDGTPLIPDDELT